jgi:hypothetical protein
MAVLSWSISHNISFDHKTLLNITASSKFILIEELLAFWNHGISSTESEFIICYGCVIYKCFATKARMESPRQLLEASLEAALKVLKSPQYHIEWLTESWLESYCAVAGQWFIRETPGGSRTKPNHFETYSMIETW